MAENEPACPHKGWWEIMKDLRGGGGGEDEEKRAAERGHKYKERQGHEGRCKGKQIKMLIGLGGRLAE